jgi:hypothetical protein
MTKQLPKMSALELLEVLTIRLELANKNQAAQTSDIPIAYQTGYAGALAYAIENLKRTL